MANSQYLILRIEAVRPLKASNLIHERMGAMLQRLQAQQAQQ